MIERERVVAEIVPPGPERRPMLAAAMLAEAVRQGCLTPPALGDPGAPPSPAPVAPLESLLAELDDDRRDR